MYREIQEIIKENFMNHPYLRGKVYSIFIFLILLLVLDISIYQSFLQLIFCMFLLALQFIWVMRKGSFVSNVNPSNLSGAISFIKYVLILQISLIYVLNIMSIAKFFANPDASIAVRACGKFFKIFGVLNEDHANQSDISNYLKWKSLYTWNLLLPHLCVSSIYITFASI
jgi:hypothetical protein